MTSKNLFKKKSHNETDESQVAASHQRDEEPTVTEMSGNSTGSNKIKKTGSTTKKGTKGVDDDEDTKRLSCDLPIPLHTSLRIGAALSQRSMLGLIETLIIKHLMDRPADKIIADYHKSRDVRGTDTQ